MLQHSLLKVKYAWMVYITTKYCLYINKMYEHLYCEQWSVNRTSRGSLHFFTEVTVTHAIGQNAPIVFFHSSEQFHKFSLSAVETVCYTIGVPQCHAVSPPLTRYPSTQLSGKRSSQKGDTVDAMLYKQLDLSKTMATWVKKSGCGISVTLGANSAITQ